MFGDHPRGLNVVRDYPGGVTLVGRRSCRSGSGGETLPEVRNWSVILPVVWNWSEDPPGRPEVVGRPSRRSEKWSGDPAGGLEMVGRPSQRFGSGLETLPEFRKWSGDPPGGP